MNESLRFENVLFWPFPDFLEIIKVNIMTFINNLFNNFVPIKSLDKITKLIGKRLRIAKKNSFYSNLCMAGGRNRRRPVASTASAGSRRAGDHARLEMASSVIAGARSVSHSDWITWIWIKNGPHWLTIRLGEPRLI